MWSRFWVVFAHQAMSLLCKYLFHLSGKQQCYSNSNVHSLCGCSDHIRSMKLLVYQICGSYNTTPAGWNDSKLTGRAPSWSFAFSNSSAEFPASPKAFMQYNHTRGLISLLCNVAVPEHCGLQCWEHWKSCTSGLGVQTVVCVRGTTVLYACRKHLYGVLL